jgi:hypothetical protein
VHMELLVQTIKKNVHKFIDLDNGIYLRGMDGYGNLVALELESMEFVIQDNLDM